MHYALCIFTMFFLCILQFRGSIQCIIQNMQYEVMHYENFDCILQHVTSLLLGPSSNSSFSSFFMKTCLKRELLLSGKLSYCS